MAGWDRKIDPQTGDYISDGRGGREKTRTLETAIYHQLQGRANQWAGDPDAGSLLHTVGKKDTSAAMQRARDAVELALRPFLEDGRAEDLVVRVDRNQVGRWCLSSSIHDVQAGELNLDPLMPYGA